LNYYHRNSKKVGVSFITIMMMMTVTKTGIKCTNEHHTDSTKVSTTNNDTIRTNSK